VVPLAWALWARDGGSGLRWWPLLAGTSLAVFVCTTPFAVIDIPAFRAGLGFERAHMAAGHLGSRDDTGLGFAALALARDLGPLLGLALAGLIWPWRRRPAEDGRKAHATVVLAWVVLAATVASARMEAERYLVPLIPLLAAIAAAVTTDLGARLGRRRWAPVAFAAAVLTAAGGARCPRGHRWPRSHADPGPPVGGGEPRSRRRRDRARAVHRAPTQSVRRRDSRPAPAWSRASEAARQRYLAGRDTSPWTCR